MTIFLAVAGLALVLAAFFGDEVFKTGWRPMGPGGGGTGIYPSISPHDSNLYFSASDMQGFYRSDDAGKTWKVFDGMEVRAVQSPVIFHPTDPNVMYVGILGGLMKSTDGGYNWEKVYGRVDRVVADIPRAIALDPRDPDTVYAALDYMCQKSYSYIIKSTDAGATWRRLGRFDAALAFGRLFAAGDDMYAVATCRDRFFTGEETDGETGIYVSRDGGMDWHRMDTPQGRVLDGAVVARKGRLRIFCLVKTAIKYGRVIGGLFRSEDGGETWQDINSAFDLTIARDNRLASSAPAMEFSRFAVADSDPDVIYVPLVRHGKEPEWMCMVYKSTDGGDTWQRALNSDADWGPVNTRTGWLAESVGWWWGGLPNGIAIAPTDPDIAVFTDDGRIMGTRDGGETWGPLYTRVHPDRHGESIGWEVTNCYELDTDPFDRGTKFIAYTDTGLFKSTDGGKTWKWAVGLSPDAAPWRGNFYNLVFDPEVKGRMWGSVTGIHDLPHWKMLMRGSDVLSGWFGTVATSDDGGETWRECPEKGLVDAPCTYLALDPKSPKNSRTLYAAMCGHGVYKSTDGGKTWQARNNGLGFEGNINAWQVHIQPNGDLLCAISAWENRRSPVPGGLFRSKDGGDRWEFANEHTPLPFLFGIAAHPEDPDIFFAACCDLPLWFGGGLRNRSDDHLPLQPMTACADPHLGGGLYKTRDGGETWDRVLEVWNCYSPAIDPADPDVVYAACFDVGVFRSADGGTTWKRLEGLPFVNVNHVCFDPQDPKRIYALTCGGGVWTTRVE